MCPARGTGPGFRARPWHRVPRRPDAPGHPGQTRLPTGTGLPVSAPTALLASVEGAPRAPSPRPKHDSAGGASPVTSASAALGRAHPGSREKNQTCKGGHCGLRPRGRSRLAGRSTRLNDPPHCALISRSTAWTSEPARTRSVGSMLRKMRSHHRREAAAIPPSSEGDAPRAAISWR